MLAFTRLFLCLKNSQYAFVNKKLSQSANKKMSQF